ncbi:MAG TPA: VOC family protein [Candidatus Didemnitutus sp.]|nr:VOC family protein [Candidatus Didemnitutus sp.]
MIRGLRTALYPAPDLARAKAWYAATLGVAPYFDEPFYVGFNVGGFELGLVPDAAASAAPGGVVAYWGVANVPEACQHFFENGATVHEEPRDVGGGITVASVLDPFGNVIGLIDNPTFNPGAVT